MSHHRGSSFGDFLTGLLVGGAVGYAMAMLTAPRPGDETRQMLEEKGRVIRDKAQEAVNETVDRASHVVEEGRSKIESTVGQVRGHTDELKERGEKKVDEAREKASDTMRRTADRVDPDMP